MRVFYCLRNSVIGMEPCARSPGCWEELLELSGWKLGSSSLSPLLGLYVASTALLLGSSSSPGGAAPWPTPANTSGPSPSSSNLCSWLRCSPPSICSLMALDPDCIALTAKNTAMPFQTPRKPQLRVRQAVMKATTTTSVRTKDWAT